MGIETDLNVSPYYDDYDETKNYQKVLFKPAVALQARELTQLQTILQNQVERFGGHLFKEGAIIKGCVFNFNRSIEYVKVLDKTIAGTDLNVGLIGTGSFLRGTVANLVSRVVDTASGLETQNPDLNTLFFNYISSDNTTKVYETITAYGVGTAKTDMYKPVNQACWCLHPVLCIGRTENASSCSLEIANYNGMNIPNYDASKVFQGGWFESMELLGAPVNDCWELETRFWNNIADSTAYAQINKNASNGVNYDNVLILQESDVYFPSFNANAKSTLGFEKAVIDTPLTTTGNLQIFDSTEVPTSV